MTEELDDLEAFFYEVEQDEGGCESDDEEEEKVDVFEYLPVTELSHRLIWYAKAQKYSYNARKRNLSNVFAI